MDIHKYGNVKIQKEDGIYRIVATLKSQPGHEYFTSIDDLRHAEIAIECLIDSMTEGVKTNALICVSEAYRREI